MKTTFLFFCFFLVGTSVFYTQVNSKDLTGQWRLDSFTDKNISKGEKQKRYTFKSDSLMYDSPGKKAAGTYTLQSETGQLDWHILELPAPIRLMIKRIAPDTLHIKEMREENPPTAVLIRISYESIAHFQKAMEAQTAKKFNVAFSELQKAAKLRHPEAMYLLGMYYFTGTATELDEKEASKWIRKAATVGHLEALSVEDSLRY